MTKTNIRFANVFFALALVCTFSAAKAQGGPGPDPDPVDIPFDGGISLMIAAGVAYAAKKGHENRKKRNENVEK